MTDKEEYQWRLAESARRLYREIKEDALSDDARAILGHAAAIARLTAGVTNVALPLPKGGR